MKIYILLALLVFTLSVILPWRFQDRLLPPNFLLGRIPLHRFSQVQDYVQERLPSLPFWIASGGVIGLLCRLLYTAFITRVLQYEVRAKHVPAADAEEIWGEAWKQVYFTLVALPEALICSLWKSVPHAYALLAFQCHYRLSISASTLLGTEDASYMTELSHLL